MSDESTPPAITAIIIPSDHGPLHGSLTLLPGSPGLVILVHTALALEAQDGTLAKLLQQAGLSVLSVDLLAREEEHFPDIRNNVPMLAKRLLMFLDQLRHRMRMGEITAQPLALYALNDSAPVIVRVAAQRDHDITVLVCHGGLIDHAGILYLHALAAPLLLLHDAADMQHIEGNRRALREVRCPNELRIVPADSTDPTDTRDSDPAIQETVRWIVQHLNR